MKKNKIIGFVLVAILIGVAGFYSCEKTYVEPVDSPNTITDAPALVLAPAAWRVTSFQWHNKSDNTQFIEYLFRFRVDGTILVLHNHIEEYGKWNKRNNIMQFSFNGDPLNELSNNWTITGHTATTASMRALDPIDNSSEFLTIEKISDGDAAQ